MLISKTSRVVTFFRQATHAFEWLLGAAIMIGIIRFAAVSVVLLHNMNWTNSETIYELINRVLLVVIGLELIRTLFTHELYALLELLAFVVARKTLKPDLTVIDIFLSVLAFTILLAGRKYLIVDKPEE